jgi:uncharacterized membrane protein YphA (DoxX/SURF4 family)
MYTDLISTSVAILMLRTITGILFLFQGYDKLFKVRISNVVRTFNDPLKKIYLNSSFLKPAIALSSMIEFICGLFLFLGLFKSIVLYLLAGNLIFVALIFSAIKPMWDMQYFFPRLILVFILLIISQTMDIFSLDHILSIR